MLPGQRIFLVSVVDYKVVRYGKAGIEGQVMTGKVDSPYLHTLPVLPTRLLIGYDPLVAAVVVF